MDEWCCWNYPKAYPHESNFRKAGFKSFKTEMQRENVGIQVLAIGMALKSICAAMGAEPDDDEAWESFGDSELGPTEKDECLSWIGQLKQYIKKEFENSK